MEKACQGFDRPTLVQKIVVRVRGSETVTRMSPSSNELFREINRTVYPPEQVHRYFEFRNGIPAEYYSFIDCEDDRNEKEHTFDQTASVAA